MVRVYLDADFEKGSISQLPIGILFRILQPNSSSRVPKKDGSPHQTINLQHLNSHCLRETHHCPSRF